MAPLAATTASAVEASADAAQALLSGLVDLTHATVNEEERVAALVPIADTIGVALAGGGDSRLQDLIAVTGLSHVGRPGSSRLPGGQLWGSATDVALVLGFAAHLLDHDDDETEVAMAHLSAPSLSAALAVAARLDVNRPGDDLISAYVTGCKAMLWVGSAMNPALYRAGWHATSVLGVLGATAAAVRLLGLDPAQTAHAFGLAASAASGPRGAFGGEGKPLQVAMAASGGVRAAELAHAGWKAPPGALAGDRGVLTRMAVVHEPMAPGSFPPPGFVTKLYPTCTATHAAVAELIELMSRAGMPRNQPPVSIRCGVDSFVPRILIPGLPDCPEAARFSLGYCLAYAALHGEVTPAAFTSEAFAGGAPADPGIRTLMARVKIDVENNLPKGPSGISTGATVTVTWADGTTLSGRRDAAPGSAASPLSSDELCAKFAAGLATLCTADEARALWRSLTTPSNFPSVGTLLDTLPPAFTIQDK